MMQDNKSVQANKTKDNAKTHSVLVPFSVSTFCNTSVPLESLGTTVFPHTDLFSPKKPYKRS